MLSHRPLVRSGAVLAAACLGLLAAGPALAAAPLAQASATALDVTIAGSGTDTGTYTVTDDGSGPVSSGSNSPALPVLTGQRLTNLGTLAQDATTSVTDGKGSSAACAGVAGEGATLAQVGDGTSCLTGGQTITLDAAHLDLSQLQITDSALLGPLAGPVGQLTQALQDTLLSSVSSALRQALTALGNPGVYVDLGAVQASCTATTGDAQGSTTLADASVYLDGPGIGRIDLVALPVRPAPNTTVPTGLNGLVEAIQTAVSTEFETALGGPTGPLAPITTALNEGFNQLVDTLQDNLIAALAPQLQPVEDSLLQIVLNKQSRPSANAIDVTALDLSVVPAAQQFVDADLVSVVIGHVTCGPDGSVSPARAVPAVDTPQGGDTPAADTSVPTAVESGADSFEDAPSPLALAALGGLVVVGTGAGVWGFRRSLRP